MFSKQNCNNGDNKYKKKLTIISAHCPPNLEKTTIIKEMDDPMTQFSNNDTILCGDFSSKHTRWGNSFNDGKVKSWYI